MQFTKVVINGKFLTQRLTGVQRYALEITKEIDSICTELVVPVELAVPENTDNLPQFTNIKIVTVPAVAGGNKGIIWEQTALALYLRKNKALGLHLCNSVPLLYPKGICCVHDITYKINPQFITTKHLFLAKIWHLLQYRVALKKSFHVFTVSNHSRQEIISEYQIPPEKISVAYNGWQHFSTQINKEDSLTGFPALEEKQFYFSLATAAKNKNFPWIVEAARENPGSVFAVAGSIDVEKLGDNIGTSLPENLVLLGYISDDDAKILMKHCKAFVFPSLYEGFGIPPLEALAMGATVICSNASCLPEIFGDAVYYINPWEKPGNLDVLLLTKEVADRESVLGRFSWNRSGRKYVDVIKSML